MFITIGEASPTRNLLRGNFWRHLPKNIRIIIITTEDKKNAYKNEFEGDLVKIETLPPVTVGFFERVLAFVARNALQTGTTQFNQMRQLHEGGSLLALILKRGISIFLGRSRLLQKIVRRAELLRKPHPGIGALYDRYRPDGLFSTVAINAEVDVPMLREARRRNIFSVGMLRGWDNFTTHGFLRVVPDRMLLQNQYLKEMGEKYHFLNPNTLEVVGFPQNDWYFKKEWIEPREQFLKNWGINPQKRIVLFGAMGDFLFPREGEIADVFEDLVQSGKISSDAVMVFRAHPAFSSPLERMKRMSHVVPDRNALYLSSSVGSWEMGEKEMAYLLNSVVHSDVVVTAGSTMALDGIALEKPVVMAAFERTPTNYWLSAKRFSRHYTHYQALLNCGGIRVVASPEELASAINDYLENPDADEEGRLRARKHFLAPFDGRSGERIANCLMRYFKLA